MKIEIKPEMKHLLVTFDREAIMERHIENAYNLVLCRLIPNRTEPNLRRNENMV